jgi:hypothetical protein
MESIIQKAKSLKRAVKSTIKTLKNRDNISNTDIGIPPTYTLNRVRYDSWSKNPPEDWPAQGYSRSMDTDYFRPERGDEYIKQPEDVISMNWYNYINEYQNTKKKYVKPNKLVIGKTYYIEKLLEPPYKKSALRSAKWYANKYGENDYHLNMLVIYKGVLEEVGREMVEIYVNSIEKRVEVLRCKFKNAEGVFPRPIHIGDIEIDIDDSVVFRFAEISRDDDSKLNNVYKMKPHLMSELKERAEEEEYNIDSVFPLGKTAVNEAKQRFEIAQHVEKNTKKSGGRKRTMKKRNRK